MEVKEASASRDLRVVPEITFGFVENFITEGSKSLGEKEISKGYKYSARDTLPILQVSKNS